MKRLLLLWLFSGSLDCFSQVVDTTQPLRQFDASKWGIKPDTLRATLIVYYDRGPAILHTKPGYVVTSWPEVYLDDKKKVIKAPWEVLTYKLK